MTETKEKTILIIGIAGGLAQILAKIIHNEHPNYQIIGIDNRNTQKVDLPANIVAKQMDYRRGNFEKLFRAYDFDQVYHLGRVSHVHATTQEDLSKRLKLNIIGTQTVLDLCLANKVERVIVLSTFHVYGALADNSVFLGESAPLRASLKYPELRDVVEMDRLCTSWFWEHKNSIKGILLRPCNIIGPSINNAISKYLNHPYSPIPMDYNPVFQFIGEYDMGQVLYKCLKDVPSGTYNIAPNDYLPLKKAKAIVTDKGPLIPISLLDKLVRFIKIPGITFPNYLLDYLKFSCLINNNSIKKHIGQNYCSYTTEEALKLLRKKD